MNFRIAVKFEPRDLWIGVYWDRPHPPVQFYDVLKVYVCVIPCFPIILTFKRLRLSYVNGGGK